MYQNVVYVAFSFCYIIVGLTITGAFLNQTIVRLFMVNSDCAKSDSDDRFCETLKNNYDNNYSANFKGKEDSFSSSKQNSYLVSIVALSKLLD